MKFLKKNIIAIIFLSAISITLFINSFDNIDLIESNNTQDVIDKNILTDQTLTEDDREDENRIRLAEERMKKIEEENKKLREAEKKRRRIQEENRRKNQSQFKTEKTDNGKYEGLYKNNLKHGKGKYTWDNGDLYDGNWVEGDKTGKGTYVWSNGDKYEGDWLNNNRTGNGTFTWGDDGTKYVGSWKDDKRIGRGKLIYTNGTFRVGKWNETKNNIDEDVYDIFLSRSAIQKGAVKENDKNLLYRIYINGNYNTVIGNYGFQNNGNIIKASPGDRVFIERKVFKRDKWYSDCTSFILQENKYNYSLTCD